MGNRTLARTLLLTGSLALAAGLAGIPPAAAGELTGDQIIARMDQALTTATA